MASQNDDNAPLIDPSLLAKLTESERAEALAAAAAAQRAERRAEERAKQRAAAAAGSSGENGSSSRPPVLSEDQEEQRALAEAQERRLRERQMERDAERERLGGRKPAIGIGISDNSANGLEGGSGGGGGGLMFVSKKKRGAGQISNTVGETNNSGISASTLTRASTKRKEGENGRGVQNNSNSHDSHLTASQLASIKKAYLGEKAVTSEATAAASYDNSARHGQSNNQSTTQNIRQRLREQRQKRRVKKTTFKFEWGAEEDTFEDDDPLYGSSMMVSSSSSPSGGRNNRYTQQQQQPRRQGGGGIGRPSNNRQQQRPPDTERGIKFGGKKMRSNYDSVATVHTVVNKPLAKMTPRDWRIYRENFNIVVKGGKSPPPLRSFREMPVGVTPIHPTLLDAIENTLKYTTPSPIQRQAIPIGMQRRDLIGIAETGSGKTAAFGVPLCHHVLSFPQSILDTVPDEGPLALVMAPTRELALQINVEFGKLLSTQKNVVSLAVVGGQSITEQATKLRNGVHVVVGTPGRINDCVEMAYLVLNQCSYIVLDEADRMIDLGFAPQIEQILDAMGGLLKSEDETEAYRQEREDLERLGKAVPSHRLTAMFSATMPSEVERIAKRYLRHPVVVSVGDQDSGKNARITQRILFLSSPGQKESTLRDLLRRSHPNEKIIVFVNEKKHAEGVGRMVEKSGRQCVVLHGGKSQDQREENLALFRRGGMVLVATDVAGRGLDIPDVQQIINFDLPTRSIDNYCHRIGRTGRAGKTGIATSFITDQDEGIMAPLKQYLESTGTPVPDKLARHPAARGAHGDFIR
mmetsp:Transcript_9686/g.21845  ORF Transcript_9686/g.21845 Transcript_9686/m.21845 type:complete len:808 (+) Transcript_9686:109-2532(+)|eukprot:CAMPEP_0172304128 /NCGR_PEP_ID=MMETSP1058-20130122/5569_1 /TAXON_ID=83371 /ORGANISM="Detonula confervacea, Strain CCMP 353" /LENGTH=807 /DNA_ID=CAMNT_0013015225 /DNA_START=47 /DNA_END=2470 /DNA_ORIENTATION=+